MQRYIIYAPHKCGSSVLFRILGDIFEYKLKEDIEHEIKTNKGFGKIILSRKYDLKELDIQSDKLICIPRNPISMTISAFYSFGYTHIKPPHRSEQEWQKIRSNIQDRGFYNYIERHFAKHYEKIADIFNFECAKKTILPYELMVSNFDIFLKDFLIAIDMQDSYLKTLEQWKSSFNPIEDQSERILSNDYKGHKRTTDIHEWKHKILKDQLNQLTKDRPVFDQYIKFITQALSQDY